MAFNPLAPPSKKKRNCLIVPIGQFNDILLSEISQHVSNIFKLEPHIQSLLNSIEFAFDKNRNQYHSTPILDKLAELLNPKYSKVIALTSIDLFIPILTHVYGEAQLGGKACIVSIARLNEELEHEMDQTFFHKRVVKEALHELGHTFNLVHCKDPQCIMHYCRSIGDVDKKNDAMCRYCSVLLSDEIKKMDKTHDTVAR